MTPYETPSEIIALNILQNIEFKQSYADQTFQTNKTIFALITQKCHEMAMIITQDTAYYRYTQESFSIICPN